MTDALASYRMFKNWLEAGHKSAEAAEAHLRQLAGEDDFARVWGIAKRLNDPRNVYRD